MSTAEGVFLCLPSFSADQGAYSSVLCLIRQIVTGKNTMKKHLESKSTVQLPVPIVSRETFPCSQCGTCCRSLKNNLLLETLDRGDGICRYLDDATSHCRIYDKRPEYCNVRLMWLKHFSKVTSWKEFVSMNKAICQKLNSKQKEQIK